MRKVLAGLIATLVAASIVGSATASPGLKIGFYDEALTLGYPDDYGYKVLKDLGAQVLRMNLYWYKVAKSKPANPTNPDDPAYDWSLYDTALDRASQRNISVLLSVVGSPGWANGGKGFQYAPNDLGTLKAFAQAAAQRYSGGAHPRVRYWIAWNEPNGPTFLRPQSENRGGTWVFTSPQTYAGICNAVVDGVNAAQASDLVACGALNPRGKTKPNGHRDSVAPVLFLQGMKAAGAHPEVIAHHPYSPSPRITPTQRINSLSTITLGNIDVLIKAVDKLWGKSMRLWVTEYGYQTDPPDKAFGVSWATQAKYMTQAFGIARKNPRIDMFLWFQLKDEPSVSGWQSGVIASDGTKKPSYAAFKKLR